MSKVVLIGKERDRERERERERERKPLSGLADYLGPAVVLGIEGSEVTVELPDGQPARADLAFAFPYSPAEGDVLLVIGKGSSFYAIGVLQGAGTTTLSFSGNVDVRAEGGSLRFWAEKGVEIAAPELSIRVDRLKTIAGAVTQKLGSLVQRVQSLVSLHARETQTLVEESAVTQAKTVTIVTEETATINGKQVHLG